MPRKLRKRDSYFDYLKVIIKFWIKNSPPTELKIGSIDHMQI